MTRSFTIRQLALTAALAGSMCIPVHARALGSKEIFAELIDRNQTRAGGLLEYTADRVYRVSDPGGKIHAQIEGRMEFEAPENKTFVTKSEEGSVIVRHLALKPLIASEINAARGKDRRDSAITPANYALEQIAEDEVRAHPCYVLRASPKRADKCLFVGKVWIDKQDNPLMRLFFGVEASWGRLATCGRLSIGPRSRLYGCAFLKRLQPGDDTRAAVELAITVSQSGVLNLK